MSDRTWDDLLAEDPALSAVTEFKSREGEHEADPREREAYGESAYWQMEMVKQAIFEHNVHRDAGNLEFIDQRGRSYFVTIADDGLSVRIVEE